jgi:hypothetical protein
VCVTRCVDTPTFPPISMHMPLPLLARSTDCAQASTQRNSKATSVLAILLYILMMRLASFPASTFWFRSNSCMGASIRCESVLCVCVRVRVSMCVSCVFIVGVYVWGH